MYHVHHALARVKFNYPLTKNLSCALVLASRKLSSYFKAHKVTVLTDQLLENVLQKLDASGCLRKWVVELSNYGIKFEARRTIKAQTLANSFLKTSGLAESPGPSSRMWSLYADGSSTTEGERGQFDC